MLHHPVLHLHVGSDLIIEDLLLVLRTLKHVDAMHLASLRLLEHHV